MEIKLTDEQIQELIKSGNIRISAENESLKGFDIYLEFGDELCCFLTGGHKYKSSDLECKFDDDEGIVKFTNHCSKCNKISEVLVPQSSLLRDLQQNYQELDDVIGQTKDT